jgi:RNA polymerase sigma factor (TIGR02999 family)
MPADREPPPDNARDAAVSEEYAAIYEELRRIARRQLRARRSGDSFATTDLVHEAYLKLAGHAPGFSDRAHFRALAARAMRQVLVDYARARAAHKRGGEWRRTTSPSTARSRGSNRSTSGSRGWWNGASSPA